MYEFHWPTKTQVGSGLVKQLGEHVFPSASAKRLLIVTPVEACARLLTQRIQAHLEKAGWEQVDTFPEVEFVRRIYPCWSHGHCPMLMPRPILDLRRKERLKRW